MANTDTWNAAFEASPADTDPISEGAERIRDLKVAVQERLSVDHYWDKAGTDTAHGEHNKITLRTGAAPSVEADKCYLYAKDVSGKAELHFRDEDGDEIQFTSGGAINSSILAAALLAHLAIIYPVGCIYTEVTGVNPATTFGFGTWVAFGEGKVLVGRNSVDTDFDTAEETGGEKTHILTEAEMPKHKHQIFAAVEATLNEAPNATTKYAAYFSNYGDTTEYKISATTTTPTIGPTSNVGSGTAHNNLQPYIVVYFWKRTA